MVTATFPGAQTERRGGAGPVGGLLGGKDPSGRFASESLPLQLHEQLVEVLPVPERIHSGVRLQALDVGPVREGAAVAKEHQRNERFNLNLFDNSSNSLVTKRRGIGTILNEDRSHA